MRQELTTDSVTRHINASPAALYDLIADVTRTPELTPDVTRCTWVRGASGPVVGARFKAINSAGHGPKWFNYPVITEAERGKVFAFTRTEPGAGTIEWRYQFEAQGNGTLVTESYAVLKPIRLFGWFIIGTLYGMKDRRTDIRQSMTSTLERLAELTENAAVAG